MINKKEIIHKTNIINIFYLQETTIQKIISAFKENKELPSISLINFFQSNIYCSVRKELLSLHPKHKKNPLLYSYSESPLPNHLNLFFNKKELLDFISEIIPQKIEKIDLSYQIFSWKDYILLHDSSQEKEHSKPSFDLIIDLTTQWDKKCGGIITYIDKLGNYHHLPCYNNTLSIIKREKNTKKYLKYINNQAKNNKKHLLIGKIITTK